MYVTEYTSFPLNPQMQVELLEIFKERGADLSLGLTAGLKSYFAKSVLKNCDLVK